MSGPILLALLPLWSPEGSSVLIFRLPEESALEKARRVAVTISRSPVRQRDVVEGRQDGLVVADDHPRRQIAEAGKGPARALSAEIGVPLDDVDLAEELLAAGIDEAAVGSLPRRQDPRHDADDVDRADDRDGDAGNGDVEEAELDVRAGGDACDEEVGGRADQRGEAAEDRQEGQRHEDMRRRDAALGRHHGQDRDEDHHHRRVVEEGRQDRGT